MSTSLSSLNSAETSTVFDCTLLLPSNSLELEENITKRCKEEFYRKSGELFSMLNQLHEDQESLLLLAENFPSEKLDKENMEGCFTLEHIESYSSACLSSLHELLNGLFKAQAPPQVISDMDRVTKCWHLIHITYGTVSPQIFTEGYLYWLNRYYPSPSQDEAKIFTEANPKEHKLFSAYLMKCALRGHTNSTVAILDSYSGDQLAKDVKHLYKTMPRFNDKADEEFDKLWCDWKKVCTKILNKHCSKIATSEGPQEVIVDLLRIMAGDRSQGETPLDIIGYYCDTWQDMLGAILLFYYPFMVPSQLHSIIEVFLSVQFPASSFEDQALDQCLLGILKSNLRYATVYANTIHPWLGAHFSDLVHKRTYLESNGEPSAIFNWLEASREEHILNYVEKNGLLAHPSLFPVGAMYLFECSNQGKDFLQKNLPLAAFESAETRDLALQICQDASLPETYNTICESSFYYYGKLDDIEMATVYLAKMISPRPYLTNQLGMYIVSQVISGECDYAALLSSLSSAPASMDYIKDFIEFLILFDKKDYPRAVERMLLLLQDNATPSFMQAILLLDGFSLISASVAHRLFNAKQLGALLQVQSHLEAEFLSGYRIALTLKYISGVWRDGCPPNFPIEVTLVKNDDVKVIKKIASDVSIAIQKAYLSIAYSK